MFLSHFQQGDLLVQRFPPVKGGALDDPLNVLQRELQFPEQQDLLQGFQCRIVIQPVTRFRIGRRPQQADPVAVSSAVSSYSL